MSYVSLRELIVETICHSGYGLRSENEKSLEKTAIDLGVLPETLLEARARRKGRETLAGTDPSGRVGNNRYQYYTFTLGMPEEAVVLWEAYAKKRGMHPTSFVRSIIHTYLRSEYEPTIRGKHWMVRGMVYSGKPIKKKSNITNAAKTLLFIRANSLNVSAASLVRALLIETMEGKICKPGSFDIVSRSQMYTDIERYCVPADAAGVPKNINFSGQSAMETLVDSYGE